LLFAAVLIFFNTLVDMAYAWADPRMREEEA